MTPNEIKTQPMSWAYDLRSGWSEVEDIVEKTELPDGADLDEVPYFSGYHKLVTLGEMESPVYVEVYSKIAQEPGHKYLLSVELSGWCERVYVANLPSLLAFLRDFAPILHAGFVTDLAAGEVSVKFRNLTERGK